MFFDDVQGRPKVHGTHSFGIIQQFQNNFGITTKQYPNI